MAERLVAADVEHFAVARIQRAGPQEGIGGIVHVDEIAKLGSVSVNGDGPVFDGQANEPGNEPLAIVLDQLPWAVDVGEAERAGAYAKHVVVDQMVVLDRKSVV